MVVSYKKLVEVEIRHDYYLPPGNPTAGWPANFNILNDIDIVPSPECEQMMRNYHIVFRAVSTGFQLLIQSRSESGKTVSFIPAEKESKWTFYLRLRNPSWINFTNQRMREQGYHLFYFNNLAGKANSTTLFLSQALPVFGTTYQGESKYKIGDFVLRTAPKRVFESKENEIAPGNPFSAAQWADIGVNDVHYANPNDRLPVQGSALVYERPNVQPGETIQFTLKDIRNQSVELGSMPGVSQNQATYIAPVQATDSVHHSLFLGNIKSGKYTISITSPSTVEPDRSFYLLNPQRDQNVFGVIELFAFNVATGFELFDFASVPNETEIKNKTYQIRFKNRQTKWRYLKQDGTVLNETDYRPLSNVPSRLQLGGKNVPDPSGHLIVSEGAAQSEIILSKIYLDHTF